MHGTPITLPITRPTVICRVNAIPGSARDRTCHTQVGAAEEKKEEERCKMDIGKYFETKEKRSFDRSLVENKGECFRNVFLSLFSLIQEWRNSIGKLYPNICIYIYLH